MMGITIDWQSFWFGLSIGAVLGAAGAGLFSWCWLLKEKHFAKKKHLTENVFPVLERCVLYLKDIHQEKFSLYDGDEKVCEFRNLTTKLDVPKKIRKKISFFFQKDEHYMKWYWDARAVVDDVISGADTKLKEAIEKLGIGKFETCMREVCLPIIFSEKVEKDAIKNAVLEKYGEKTVINLHTLHTRENISLRELVDRPEFDFIVNKLKALEGGPTIVEFKKVKNEALFILDDIEKWVAKRTKKW